MFPCVFTAPIWNALWGFSIIFLTVASNFEFSKTLLHDFEKTTRANKTNKFLTTKTKNKPINIMKSNIYYRGQTIIRRYDIYIDRCYFLWHL